MSTSPPLAAKHARLRQLVKELSALANDILEDTGTSLRASAIGPAGIAIIQGVVCDAYGLPLDAITQRSRLARHVEPRQVAFWLCRQLLRIGDEEIGKGFKRSRSNVTDQFKAVEDRMATEPAFQRAVIPIRERAERCINNYDMPLFTQP
jgi:chromosomal replication initiation ATPase DnaA